MGDGLDKPKDKPAATLQPAAQPAVAANPWVSDEPIFDKRHYKLYNFRRPDKFSKDHLRALQTIHEGFARQLGMLLTAYLRMSIEIDVVSVDQLTYDEFVHSMPSPMSVAIVEMIPLPGQVMLGFSHEVTSSVIDRMLGGMGVSENKPRELTDIEQQLVRRVIDRAMRTLEEAWSSVVQMENNLVGMEDSYALIQVASPGEIVSLITFEVNFSKRDSGLMSLCIPFPVLEGIIDQLSAQHIFHGQTRDPSPEEQNKVLARLNHAKIPVQVMLGGTRIRVGELVDLAVGDVIRLNRRVSEPLMVSVNGKPKFFARPGTMRNHLAVSVTDPVQEDEIQSSKVLEGFGLNGK